MCSHVLVHPTEAVLAAFRLREPRRRSPAAPNRSDGSGRAEAAATRCPGHDGGVTRSKCEHGVDQRSCEICRVLVASSSPLPGGGGSSPRVRRRLVNPLGLGLSAIAAVVGLVLLVQVVAAAWAVVRLLELVAVATVAGWIGWKLGVGHGRRSGR